ncbi:MAG: Ig-like domain-containing protein [Flavobacteriales bacterium]
MQNTLLILISFWLVSCATKLRPTGGERDTSPPVLNFAKPVSGTTNFDAYQFELKFDEFLKPEHFEKLILVSPNIEDLKVDYHGKKLVVSWKNELKANTSYNFQFLQSIKDYTESNVLSNFQYVLSTGNQIDSLKISGHVDWLDSKPNTATLICLVEENQFNDSTFLTSDFNYTGMASQQNGTFTVDYLAEGNYHLFAFEDKNQNNTWDQKDESFGFFPLPIQPIDSQELKLQLSDIQTEPTFSKLQFLSDKQLILAYPDALPEDSNFTVFDLDKQIDYQQFVDKKEQVVRFSFSEALESDSFSIVVSHLDTFSCFRRMFKPVSKTRLFDQQLKDSDSLVLISNYIVNQVDTSKIKITIGDSTLAYSYKFESNKIQFYAGSIDANLPIQISLADSALVYDGTIFSQKNQFRYQKKSPLYYGDIRCKFNENQAVIIQLLDKDLKLVDEQTASASEKEIRFQKLEPKTYHIRLIRDLNGDGKFTRSNPFVGQTAEPVLVHKKPIKIKSNWTHEIQF